mmetsp:Transcript_39136/g.75025  ORF Transcript_39136/g.75025 Transcript_39136/m.75025 type:complete len:207 (+) Transcript_39136:426-1046(+)
MFVAHWLRRCNDLTLGACNPIKNVYQECWDTGGPARIYFSQDDIQCTFTNAAEGPNERCIPGDTPGLIRGKSVFQVADMLKGVDGGEPLIKQDELIIHVFKNKGKWYAINNRGFTTHNIAGVIPLRIMPRYPTGFEDHGARTEIMRGPVASETAQATMSMAKNGCGGEGGPRAHQMEPEQNVNSNHPQKHRVKLRDSDLYLQYDGW